MKVIEPLFLNDLYEELDKVSGSTTKLQKLQQRLSSIKVFDPACGSGNFLIVAYKELRQARNRNTKANSGVGIGEVRETFPALLYDRTFTILRY